MPGKTCESMPLANCCLANDDAAARAAQALVRGGGDEVGVRHGLGMHAAGDEPGDVRHVHEEIRADANRRSARMRGKSMMRG